MPNSIGVREGLFELSPASLDRYMPSRIRLGFQQFYRKHDTRSVTCICLASPHYSTYFRHRRCTDSGHTCTSPPTSPAPVATQTIQPRISPILRPKVSCTKPLSPGSIEMPRATTSGAFKPNTLGWDRSCRPATDI